MGSCFEDGGGSGPELTPQQKLQHAVNNVYFNPIVSTDSNLNFMSSWIYGVTITWNSNRQNLISNTGIINRTNSSVVEVQVTAMFRLGNHTQSKNYTFYVLPKSDLSDENLPLSNEWFNSLDYTESVGTVYDGSREHHIFVDQDFLFASRMELEPLTYFSTSAGIVFNEGFETSWGTTTSLSASLQTQLAISANAFFVEMESTISYQIGSSFSVQNNWKQNTTKSYPFDNPRIRYDSSGNVYYMPMRVVLYKLYVPLRIETYSIINLPIFSSPYKFLSKTAYIVSPIRTGLVMQWADDLIEDWRGGLDAVITLDQFYGEFTPVPTSISMIF